MGRRDQELIHALTNRERTEVVQKVRSAKSRVKQVVAPSQWVRAYPLASAAFVFTASAGLASRTGQRKDAHSARPGSEPQVAGEPQAAGESQAKGENHSESTKPAKSAAAIWMASATSFIVRAALGHLIRGFGASAPSTDMPNSND